MYLKHIEIRGFKSFADRTLLELKPGMTAVVGPNGCGKSNIVDAIRWVLGEQSAKALRGASMQDVIFDGTEKRKALPISEVALVFTDCEKDLNTAFNEVEVSRKVTREGSSNYFINGKSARLKDIQRLFANTGIGRVSYSFMLQGQIDQVLSTNASERRTIFEEAAGITLYKSQRREALNKLTLVDTNLTRVTDIMDEVTKQIGSLKRQATKALKYRKLEYKLKHLDLSFSGKKYSEINEYLLSNLGESKKEEDLVKKITENLDTEESDLLLKKKERNDIFSNIQSFQQKSFDIKSEKENLINEKKLNTIRSNDANNLIELYNEELKSLEEERNTILKNSENILESRQQQLDLVGDSDLDEQDQETNFLNTQKKLESLVSQIENRKSDFINLENRINKLRAESTSSDLDAKTYQIKHSSFTDSIYALKQDLELHNRDLTNLQKDKVENSNQLNYLEDLNKEAQNQAVFKLKEFRKLKEEYQIADRLIAKKTEKLNILQDLQARFEGFAQGAKSILKGELSDSLDESETILISKIIKVDQGYTTALQALLGIAVDALFVGNINKSFRVIKQLSQKKLGRVCLQFKKELHYKEYASDLPHFLVPAISKINILEKSLTGTLKNYFDGCYFCDEIEDFIEFWKDNSKFNFLFVSSKNGELVDSRGLLYGGVGVSEQTSGVLERINQIALIESEIKSDKIELNRIKASYEKVEDERNKANAQLDKSQSDLMQINQIIASLKSEEKNQKEKIDKTSEEIAKTESLIEELDEEHSNFTNKSSLLKEDLIEAQKVYSLNKDEIIKLEEEVDQVRINLEAQRNKLTDVRLRLAEKRQMILSVEESISRIDDEKKSIDERIIRRKQEISKIKEQIVKFANDLIALEEKSNDLDQSYKLSSEELLIKQKKLGSVDEFILSKENELMSKRKELKDAESNLNQMQILISEKRTKMEFIKEKIYDDYQLDLASIDWKAEYWESQNDLTIELSTEGLEDFSKNNFKIENRKEMPSEKDLMEMESLDWIKIENIIKEIKTQISGMGPVNVDSIGEYTDLKERYDFLKEQSNDLWESKNLLIKSIDEINEKSLSMFAETFSQIKENFAYTYGKLSGGGISDLKLIDTEDPLESGIDIIARPPGTRLKNISLLSGGQRTMAAVSLLFAIYLVKPSPFCVLDEIDAALDDANIGRFCEILRDFTEKSQFLIITHNKRTISNADLVFGVTMPEKGVSKVISMQFNKKDNNKELLINK